MIFIKRTTLLFAVLFLTSCAANPAEYVAGIFGADTEQAQSNPVSDSQEPDINTEELSKSKSFIDGLIFWDTDTIDVKNSNIQIKNIWSIDIGSGRDAASAVLHPSFKNNSEVFTIDTNGLITSVDTKTGEVNWRYNTKLDVTSGILFYDDKLFFGTSDGKLYGFDTDALKNENSLISSIDFTNMLSGGSVLPIIELQLNSEIASPAIGYENIIYFKQGDGDTSAVNILENRIEWIHQGKNVALSLKGSAAVARDFSNIYVARDDGNFVSLTNDTGKLNWLVSISPKSGRNELESLRDIEMTPSIKDGLIYIGSYQGSLISVDMITGETVWRRQLSIHSNVAIDNDNIYITSSNGDLYGLDRFSGDTIWRSIVDKNSLFTAPVSIDQYIISFSVNGYIAILDKNDGKVLHYNKMLDNIDKESSVYVIDKTLYIVTKNGRLNAVKLN